KAYGLIERFSEDLDLFVFTGDKGASKQAEKTLNKKLSKHIAELNSDIYKEDLSETGGNYRKLYFSYDNVFQGVGLKEHLEVEIKSCDLPDKKLMFYPADKRVIKPIVTSFLESIGQDELISTYGLESFETQCINPRKTICDKVSRLVKLSYNEDATALLAKHIRDVYDLSALYHNQEYNDYLHSEDFLDAMYRVTIEDGLNKNSRSHLSLADAPIFKDSETVMALPEVTTAYTTDLKKLTFDKSKMPPIGKAVEALKKLHEILVRFEAYRTKKQNEEQP
ncbi:nucleotidyl transferase AbiEii/AbiGii toxin family protein, partial [Bacteroides sp. AF37-16AC]